MKQFLKQGEREAPLIIWVGAALILSGWAANFTLVGAQLIWFGSALVILGALLAHNLRWSLVGLFVLLIGWVALPLIILL